MRESLADFCHREHREELLIEWDTEKNLPLTPETVSRGSKHRVWWTCAHGHHWQAAVHTRSGSGTGCPYCTGHRPIPGETDLATLYPHVASQWHPTLNRPLSPTTSSPAAAGKCGGSVRTDTSGKPSSTAEPAPKTAAALSVQATPAANAAPATNAC